MRKSALVVGALAALALGAAPALGAAMSLGAAPAGVPRWPSDLNDLRQWVAEQPAEFYQSLEAKQLRKNLEDQREQLTGLIRQLVVKSEELQLVAPAVQWAESNDTVYLQVKMAARWSSPGALSVEDEKIELQPRELFFSGVGTHSGVRKLYQLAVPLRHEIQVPESTWRWGSLGKLQFTLKKAETLIWQQLVANDAAIPSTITQWWEMTDKIEEEIKRREEAEKAEKKTKEEAASKTAEKKAKEEAAGKTAEKGTPEKKSEDDEEEEGEEKEEATYPPFRPVTRIEL